MNFRINPLVKLERLTSPVSERTRATYCEWSSGGKVHLICKFLVCFIVSGMKFELD